MLTKQKIERINQLYRKSKTSGLSEEEKQEQSLLRQEYIDSVRSSLKSNLLHMKVVDEQGEDVTPQKLKDEQEKRKIN